MKKSVFASLLIGSVSLSVSLTANARNYQDLDTQNSEIGFQYSQMGVKMDGQFRKFDGEFNFNPEALDQSKVVLKVALDSVDTGSDEADDELQDVRWFDIDAHPQAVFSSKSFRAVSAQQYEVQGTLQIKGREQSVTFMATMAPEGDKATFSGEFGIKRGDFSIGEGSWSSYDIVANEITVNFKIDAK